MTTSRKGLPPNPMSTPDSPDRSALLRVREQLASAATRWDEEDQEDPGAASYSLRHTIEQILEDLQP